MNCLFRRSWARRDLARPLQLTPIVRDRGFTLIEVLVAASIVIVAISGLAQLFVASSAANLRARSRTLGTVLATAKMEELRAAADAPAAGLDYADARGNAFEQRTGSARGATFVRRWTVVAMPSNPGALVLEVEVRFPQASPGEVVRLTALKASRAP